MARKRKEKRTRRRAYARHSTRSRKSGHDYPILPTTLGIAAAALPFVTPGGVEYAGNFNFSALDIAGQMLTAPPDQIGGMARMFFQTLASGAVQAIPDMIGLGVVAGGMAYGAKKFGLRRATKISEHVSVF